MSADNGIYIAEFVEPAYIDSYSGEQIPEMKTYRVVHAQAIDNVNYHFAGSQEWEATLVRYFGHARIWSNKKRALDFAQLLYDEYTDETVPGNWCPYVEYGIQVLKFGCPFPRMTMDQAQKIDEEYWKRVSRKEG